jgi:hypothetical protein
MTDQAKGTWVAAAWCVILTAALTLLLMWAAGDL